MNKYRVATSRFRLHTIKADYWECSGNGLKFYRKKKGKGHMIAWFLDWRWWKEI